MPLNWNTCAYRSVNGALEHATCKALTEEEVSTGGVEKQFSSMYILYYACYDYFSLANPLAYLTRAQSLKFTSASYTNVTNILIDLLSDVAWSDVVGFSEIYDSHSNKNQEVANTISYYSGNENFCFAIWL